MDPPPRRNKYGWPIIDEPDEAEPAPAEPAPAEVNPFDPSRPLSSVEKRILRHAGGVGGIPALLAKVDRLASEVIETASPSSRRHYDLAKHIFEACVATYSMPVRIEDYWAVEIVRTYAPKYLSFRVNTSDGRQGERVKAITVLGWYSHIIVVICKYTHDPKTGQKCGGALLYTEGLHDELENQLHKEALSRHSLTRGHSFGLPEVKLCIESGLRDSTSRGREARVQEIAMLIIGLATGVRACGLVGTEAEYIKEGKYMKAGDLKVSNHGNTDYSIELRIMNHKASARNFNSSLLGRVVMYTITGRKLIENVLFDPFWIVLHLWFRGALGEYETLDDLISAEEAELRITTPDAPLFVACKPGGTELLPIPLNARAFGGQVKGMVTKISMPFLRFYDLRRTAADEFSNKIGPQSAGLILGHKDSNSLLTQKYSYGPGNLDVLGIRTGEAEDQFLPGTKSRLELRLRSGSAICLVSKAIAALAHDQDEQDDEDNEDSVGNVALASLEKKNKKTVKDARKQAVKDNSEVHAAQQEVNRRWDRWLQLLDPGSPLFRAAKKQKKKQNMMSKITNNPLYEEIQDEDLKQRLSTHESDVRDAFKALVTVTQRVSRQATKITKSKIASDFSKSNIDTYQHKDQAVAHSKEKSSLVAQAIKTASKAETLSQSNVAAINREEDNTPAEQAVEDCRAALNFSIGRMVNQAPNDVSQALVDDILDKAADDVEIPEEDADLFRDGKPPEPWKEVGTKKITNVTVGDVRAELMHVVAAPVLFERECKANFEKNGGKYVCENCQRLDPTAEPATFTSETNLRKHRRNLHTEWNDLEIDMQHEDKFKCPGVCGPNKQFKDVRQTRKHCLSADCADQKGFIAMKAIHDEAMKHNAAARKRQPAAQELDIRQRDQIRQQHLQYFASLDADDLRELADEFEIPRERVEPQLERMLSIFHFTGNSLIE